MRSIYRSKEHAELIKKLTEKSPITGVAVFPTIKALQCFAAVIGFDQKRRKRLDRSDVDNIEWHTFENTNHTHYIYLIALAETNDLNVLKYDVENSDGFEGIANMVEIFEEYANGGFEILASWLAKNPSDPFGNKAILAAMEKAGFLKAEPVDFLPIEF